MRKIEYMKMYEAEDAHWWYVSLHGLILSFVPDKQQPQLIMDAGCGTGRLLQLLTEYGEVQGCDVSDLALHYCRERGVLNVAKADLNNMHMEEGRYDIITSIDVLYHQRIKSDRMVLDKMFGALKPGGVLILQVPAYEWLRSNHDRAVHTGRRYMKAAVVKMLADCGFQIEKATYRVSLLFALIAFLRLAQKIFFHGDNAAMPSSDVRKHSKAVNALLGLVMKTENTLLKYISFPFGASIFALARKPNIP